MQNSFHLKLVRLDDRNQDVSIESVTRSFRFIGEKFYR